MELNSPCIAHDSEDYFSHQTGQKPPCTIADAKVYLDEKQDSEDGVVEGITTE